MLINYIILRIHSVGNRIQWSEILFLWETDTLIARSSVRPSEDVNVDATRQGYDRLII